MVSNTANIINRPLNLTEGSILKNILCCNCDELTDVICKEDLADLSEHLNRLLLIKSSITENPACKKIEDVNIFIIEMLQHVLTILPPFIGGLEFYGNKISRDDSQIIWDISSIEIFFLM